jgi:hypothetical protein
MPLNSSLIRGHKVYLGKPNCNLEDYRYRIFPEKSQTKSVVSGAVEKIEDFEICFGL